MKRTLIIITSIIILLVITGVFPFTLGFAEGNSMEPTIPKHSVFIIQNTESVSEGDIVVFHSPLEKNEVTHRIVDKRPEGFITKGDANDVNDQAIGEPPVTEERIIGKVVEVGGSPLYLSGTGKIAMLIQNNIRFLIGALSVILISLFFVSGENNGRGMGRVSEREKDYFHPIFFLGVIAIIVLIFALSSTSPFFFVYNDNPSSETVVGLNETPESISIVETNYQPFSYRVVSITSPLKIDKINSQNKTAVNMTVTGPVRQTEGVERGEVQVYHYPKILPKNIIESLHNIHPLIATTVVGFVAFTPIYIIYLLIIDPKKPIRELREHFNQPRE